MKKIPKSLVIILLLLTISGIIVYSFSNEPPHQFTEGQCGFCHLNYEQPFRFRDNISTLCNYCHGKRNVLSHMVGIKPSMQVPEAFHLDEKGEMTCDTCHNIHMNSTDAETGERTYLLRSNLRGGALCNACHVDTTTLVQTENAPTHSDVLEQGHFGYETDTGYSVDKVSHICLNCHEGAMASSAPTIIVGQTGASHPIGMDYLTEYNKNKELRSPSSLSSQIKLFEGKVGCPSCHNPFSLAKHQLSITNEESKLCFECHLK